MYDSIDDINYLSILKYLFLFILTYSPILLLLLNKKSTWLLILSVIFVISAHHLVSILNILYWPLPGADLDAFNFHQNAKNAVIDGKAPKVAVGTDFYEYVLYKIYLIFGSQLIIGQFVSIFLFSLSCIVIIYIASFLEITSINLLGLLVIMVGLVPSSLFFTSLTFRESFQVFLFVVGIAFSILSIKNKSFYMLLIASSSFIIMGFFHHILLFMAVLFILITMVFYILINRRMIHFPYLGLMIGSSVIVLSGYYLVIDAPVTGGNDYLRILRETGGILEMIERYRSAVEENLPRSAFGYSISVDSWSQLVVGLSRSYISYLFGPNIVSIERIIDFVPFANSLWRILVVISVVLFIIKSKFKIGWKFWYLVICFLVMSSLWSIGTTNYGQALRHNVLTDWLLAIIFIFISYQVLSDYVCIYSRKKL